jgi:Ser/Thr protein kinase RdoA (MazF antagonist)
MRELRHAGAQVPRYIGEAALILVSDVPGGFVATATNYLPGNQASFREYGAAIASLHTASTEVDITRIPLINPLAPVERHMDYLKTRQDIGDPFRIGETELTGYQLQDLERHLQRGTKMLDRLFAMCEAQGHPLVVVQEDVHSQNVLQDAEGSATLIDIEPFKGPAALDFGRPLTDWHHRFGRPMLDTDDFIRGYRDTVRPEMMPDEDTLRQAADYINIRSSLILFNLAVDAVRSGHTGEEWMLRESIHRLNTIDNRHAHWNGLDNARKKALRENRG